MPKTEAQKRATLKYDAKAYDRVELKVEKGKKTSLQAHAAARNESLNGFINRAIDGAVERDNNTPQDDALTARVYKAGPDGMIDTEERI